MAISPETLQTVLQLAGFGQMGLALGSLAIPKALGWSEELTCVKPLTRQVFWVYALYIWCSHMAFAAVSVLARQSLTEGSVLAACVTAFIAAWWGVRLVIQFTVLDRSAAPSGAVYRWGEVVLVTLFVCFTAIYGYAAVSNVLGSVR